MPDDPEFPTAPNWALLVTAVAAVVISILGFFGNLLTILALPYSLRLRNAATWFVVNLAVAEGIFCVTILPMSAAHLFHLYVTGTPMFTMGGCSAFVFLRYVNIQAELLSIAAIAVNRCVLIAVPKKYPKVYTGAKTIIIITAIWAFSIFLMLIPLLEIYGHLGYNNQTDECDFMDDTPAKQGPRKLFLAIGFLLPCVVIIASYSYIFYKARQSSAKVQARRSNSLNNSVTSDVRNSRPAEGLRSRDIRIARTIGVIFLAFLICCMPVSIVHYLYWKIQSPSLLLLLHPLYWAQYCINIFIYVFMNRQYRDAYVNYISRWWPDFRELSRRNFKWKEEPTSDSGRRVSRAHTPSSVVKFATRKNSKTSFRSPNDPPGTPKAAEKAGTPMLSDTRI
ncbi:G-protein coupled receptor moody isoform X1 [Penaeus vannamei]|uniref:G-protein coupled receptor moody isoform X1 n=1 Tax=Penaeus vannamei TaxID=6689 RepID=UPI00387F6BE5